MRRVVLVILLLSVVVSGFSQRKRKPSRVPIENLQNFDKQRFHFGFILGYNSADFFVDIKPNTFQSDSLINLLVQKKPGFNLGIVTSWDWSPMFKLRFLPTLSFQERSMDYNFYSEPDTNTYWKKSVQSTYLDFPLLLKMRTQRINNFAAYVVGGGRFGIDMQSNNKVDNDNASPSDQVIKLTRPDYGIEVGGGFDFFLQYFKFGIELKMGMGLKNILIQENTIFTTPIESIRSKVWTVSLTFEG
ncbi:type IX secretion/gliding motility protein PorT/SprT [Parvicella tangerina]|uniref:Outer membrane protein beta-barrel domain-containing protein n=1 Tax=Parvicella tangerina TaxID=2829795 RepID=A0A916JLN4_9FLAO|nr:porin family protein [Parvicella tangerina]CAG5080412.1 hypothetical protein CRYO30217_01299 [Parvicella tangerina]